MFSDSRQGGASLHFKSLNVNIEGIVRRAMQCLQRTMETARLAHFQELAPLQCMGSVFTQTKASTPTVSIGGLIRLKYYSILQYEDNTGRPWALRELKMNSSKLIRYSSQAHKQTEKSSKMDPLSR